mmetsp:Transcript_29867/g.58364  ORF Transcript_29867/g.58364 Transcript_29867/m.58364 type:complete len:309 (-) Transcript_29867:2773-3699(-)
MDLAQPRSRSKRQAHVQLTSVFGVVLVEQVIERFVQIFTVHENDSASLRHTELDVLEVEANLQVRLVCREIRPENDFGVLLLAKSVVEQKRERSVILREKHKVAGFLRLNVLTNELYNILHFGASARDAHGVVEHVQDLCHVFGLASKVALNSVHDDACVQLCVLLLRKHAVDVANSGVEFTQSPEVLLLLAFVHSHVSTRNLSQESGELRVLHHALSSLRQISHSWGRAVEVHGAVHLGGVESPVGDTDESVLVVLIQDLVQHLERQVRGLLSQPNFVKQHNTDGVWGGDLVPGSSLEGLFDTVGGR